MNILGKLNEGAHVLMTGLDIERVILAAGPLGIMQAACDTAFEYCHTRQQFGQPIGTFQIMQAKMADMYTRLMTSRQAVYGVARMLSSGVINPAACAAAFLHSSTAGIHVAVDALQCLGGNGYTNSYPTGRYLRDAKLYDIGGGTNEIRQIVIARNISRQYL